MRPWWVWTFLILLALAAGEVVGTYAWMFYYYHINGLEVGRERTILACIQMAVVLYLPLVAYRNVKGVENGSSDQ
jgi:hypothetical protein